MQTEAISDIANDWSRGEPIRQITAIGSLNVVGILDLKKTISKKNIHTKNNIIIIIHGENLMPIIRIVIATYH